MSDQAGFRRILVRNSHGALRLVASVDELARINARRDPGGPFHLYRDVLLTFHYVTLPNGRSGRLVLGYGLGPSYLRDESTWDITPLSDAART